MSGLPYDELYYNQVRAKASHNSYQRKEGLSDQFAYWRIRSLELDLHNGNDGAGWPALPNDWYVYHVSVSDDDSSVRTFSDALKQLAGFHAAVPDHEVCTIALDIKDSFDASHTPQQLDALINAALPGLVYTPAQFLNGNSNLQQSAGDWPTLAELRGKFVFILTTGNIDSPNSHLNQYVDNGASANVRTGFVAPEISSVAQITAKNYVVWFNMKIDDAPTLGPEVLKDGFMSRAYGGNNQSEWNKGISGKNHLIGTDNVNSLESPWARTDNSHGWPFQGITVNPDADITEPGVVIGMRVSSDDIWGTSDSCALAAFAVTGTDHTYTYGVAIPGSDVPDNWGKAGLMARSSSNANAANFCVVRGAADNIMRVQSRARDGDSTHSWDLPMPPNVGIDLDTWMYLRLTISNAGKTAEAWGSFDGSTWTSIHRQDFAQPLALQGIVGSSHDIKQSIRYLYFPVGDSAVANTLTTSIGKNVSASAFAGVYPAS